MSDFLDSITESVRPEPNVEGSFDCMECGSCVERAHYDRSAKRLRWWCQDEHESVIEKIDL